jgi:hypothetical protein
MSVRKRPGPGIAWMSVWLSIVALAWQTIRTAARIGRLERATHTWLVVESPAAKANQHPSFHHQNT